MTAKLQQNKSGTNLFEDAITESEELQKYDVPDSSTSEENDIDNDSQEETFENFFRQQRRRQKKIERVTAKNVS